MALPKVETPIYTLTLPSNGKAVKFRPFIMKEEKALLFAYQSEDEQVLNDTLKEIVKACTLNELDVDNIPLFDLEYIFVKLRINSVGSLATLLSKCDVCQSSTEFEVDLDKVAVSRSEDHSNKIPLFGNVGVVMKYPTYEVVQRLRNLDFKDPESNMDLIIEHMDYVYDSEKQYPAAETQREELVEFINNLTQAQMTLIKEFFKGIPRLQYKTVHMCGKCGTPKDIKLEGLKSFF